MNVIAFNRINMKEATAQEVIKLIKSGDTIVVGGSGAGHGVPDALLEALGKNFVSTGFPSKITVFNPCGIGDNNKRGLKHIVHVGLELIEIAPGVDVEKDVLAMMDFKPLMNNVKHINPKVYNSSTMQLVL